MSPWILELAVNMTGLLFLIKQDYCVVVASVTEYTGFIDYISCSDNGVLYTFMELYDFYDFY